MCGICGFFSCGTAVLNLGAAQQILENMTTCLSHRGPDGHGEWLDADAGIALGHRRLSIRDISPAGAQPMHSHCGRYVLTYNGEIYNSEELRHYILKVKEQPPCWQGHSDTEVFLEACATLGIHRTLELCIGMFSFALWDKKEHRLILGRDRFGVKPLYWTVQNNTLLFASEVKSLRRYPYFNPEIDRNRLAAFFRCNYLPDPLTIFADVHKLRPGCVLIANGMGAPREEPWWSAREVALAGIANRIDCHKEALDELHHLVQDAVSRRMVADVAIGAFLSGGVDSSLVVAVMQEAASRPINTYSIGFEEVDYNEAPYAKAIAAVLGTQHTELYITSKDAAELIPQLPQIYDDLFADSSQIPTYFLSRLARRDVMVALSGDGGDEFFAGYAQHSLKIPFYRNLPTSRSHLYQRMHLGRWRGMDVVPGGRVPSSYFVQGIDDDMFLDDGELAQFIDTVHYLPGDILHKVDRASMAVSLEVRPPLLDHRIYALAWRMPPHLRRACGKAKWPLRHLLNHYVSPELTERPKQGFALPLLSWVRGPLRDWAESLLDPARLRREAWLSPEVVALMWKEALEGRQNMEQIWAVLMFQSWLEMFIKEK